MSDPAESPLCPACGAALAADAGGGWCPRCALAGVFDVRVDESVLFTVPGHAVLAELGRGATGIVYRARQEQPAREVALKILRPHELGSAESLARFRLEAATVAALDHPAILPVLSVGEHDGLPYFTMKLCDGSLADRLAAYRGRWRESAQLMAGLAEAVHHAHMRGVLHRDLKPGNVLFDEAGRPFVSDFGLAKLIEASAVGGPATRPLLVMGTPGYLAPEVLQGGAGQATTAADLFALGAMLHELLTGAPPPASDAATAPRPGVPRDLAVICAHALAAAPDRRYPTAEALAADLRAWLAGRPIAARPQSGLGHAWAWARRNPALTFVGLALGVTLVGGSAILEIENRAMVRALAETRAAEKQSQLSLARALTAQARAVRQSGRIGQRFDAMALLAQAAKIHPATGTREEAVAALALPDWTVKSDKPWEGTAASALPSPDFSLMLVENDRHEYSLREVATGKVRWVWAAAESASRPVYSPDGRWIAVRLVDDTVHVLAAADGKELFSLAGRPYAFKNSVRLYGQDMDFTADGSRLAVTRAEGGVTFHGLPGGEPQGEWTAPEWVTSIAWSPDGTKLAVAGSKRRQDNLLAVVDAASGKTLARSPASARMEFVLWSPDGRWLATRPAGGLTEVRAAADLGMRATVPDGDALYGSFLAGGRYLLLAAQSGRTRLWEVDRGVALLDKGPVGQPGSWFARNPLRLLNHTSDGEVKVARLEESPVCLLGRTSEIPDTVRPFGAPAVISPAGRWLLVGGWNGSVVFDLQANRTVARLAPGTDDETGSPCFSPSGKFIWVSLERGGLWRYPFREEVAGGLATGPGEKMDAEGGFYFADLNAATGRMALVSPTRDLVRILDAESGRELARWPHRGAVGAAFSPDGGRLVVNGWHRADADPATVHDTLTGRTLRVLESKAGDYAAWSPDGQWIYAGFGNGRAELWRTADWSAGPKLLRDEADYLRVAAFSPSGRTLVARDADNHFRLVETATGRVLANLTPPESMGFIAAVVFAGEGRVVGVSIWGGVYTWEVAVLRRELAGVGLDWPDTAAGSRHGK